MENIIFYIDSSTELTDSLRQREDIGVVDDYVTYDDKSLKDSEMHKIGGVPGLLDIMKDCLREKKPLPKTSNPNAGEFAESFRENRDKGYTHVIGLFLPEAKSGAWNSAMLGKKQVPEMEYFMPKMRTISVATTHVLEEAVAAYDNGAGFEELQEIVMDANNAVEGYFTVDELAYLVEGGRIGKAQGLLASALSIKPIIMLGRDKEKNEYGDFIGLQKVRTMKKTAARLGELITGAVEDGRKYIVSAGESMYGYAQNLVKTLSNADYIAPTSGALVANGGPFIIVTGLPLNYRNKK